MTGLGTILVLDHTDGVIGPLLGHGPYLCVGITIITLTPFPIIVKPESPQVTSQKKKKGDLG